MEKRDSDSGRPATAMQLAAIIWLPIIVGGLAYLIFTMAQKGEAEASARNKATADAVKESIASCRRLAKRLATLPTPPGEAPVRSTDCNQLEKDFADIDAGRR